MGYSWFVIVVRYDTYFYKVFKLYTQLWKYQQENREKLVEAGLKRWEIGEIASRIAQLYFGQYMWTSDMSYLSESYIFYDAILTREYFRDGLYQHLNLANKQLRFLARFLMVCLVLNRREMVNQLVDHLKMLLDECKRTFSVYFYFKHSLHLFVGHYNLNCLFCFLYNALFTSSLKINNCWRGVWKLICMLLGLGREVQWKMKMEMSEWYVVEKCV